MTDLNKLREMLATDGVINLEEERKAFESQLKNDGFVEFSGYSLEKCELDFYTDERVECAWHSYMLAHRRALKVAVPKGFVLVPKEPTKEMLIAGEGVRHSKFIVVGDIYKAMIAAAQEQNNE